MGNRAAQRRTRYFPSRSCAEDVGDYQIGVKGKSKALAAAAREFAERDFKPVVFAESAAEYELLDHQLADACTADAVLDLEE